MAGLLATAAGLLSCQQGGPLPPISAEPPPESGPVVAKAKTRELRAGQLPALASLGAEMRLLAGAEAGGDAARLALEAFALLAEAEASSLLSTPPVQEKRQRLLARSYLSKFARWVDREPLSERDLQDAFRAEWNKALSAGDSEICVPTRMDGLAATVGYFPDLHPPRQGEPPLLGRAEVLELADAIYRQAATGRDADDFSRLVRRFMAGHPTISLQQLSRVPRGVVPPGMSEDLHRMLFSGDAEGLVGPPREFSSGAVVLWRVGIRPGRGESLADVRGELERLVRNRRLEEAARRHIEELLLKTKARVFHEALGPEQAKDGAL